VLEALVQPPKNVEDEDSVFDGEPRSARPWAMVLNLRQYSDTEGSP
jgi:hypothetical protein